MFPLRASRFHQLASLFSQDAGDAAGDVCGRSADPAGAFRRVQGGARSGEPRPQGLVASREVPSVERSVANAEGEGGSGRVCVSRTPLRRGERERLGAFDGVRTRPASRVADDAPVRFLGLAEARRVPAV